MTNAQMFAIMVLTAYAFPYILEFLFTVFYAIWTILIWVYYKLRGAND